MRYEARIEVVAVDRSHQPRGQSAITDALRKILEAEGELLSLHVTPGSSASALLAVAEFYEATVARNVVAKYNDHVADVGVDGWNRQQGQDSSVVLLEG